MLTNRQTDGQQTNKQTEMDTVPSTAELKAKRRRVAAVDKEH